MCGEIECSTLRFWGSDMISVEYIGGLGNVMFQYCFGRILAESLGYKLDASPIKGFSNTNQKVDGLEFLNDPIKLIEHNVDLDSLEQNRKIICRGYFQKLHYYEKYHDVIKNDWLKLNSDLVKEPKDPQDVVLHIRRGDYVTKNISDHLVGVDFYDNILKNYVRDWNKLYICTDSPGDSFFDGLMKYDPIIKSSAEDTWRHVGRGQPTDTTLEDFTFMMSFNRIVLSVSTFSWWASFLSNASELYYPNFGYFNKENGYENYLVRDEPRTIFCK